jgi:hypothetical protein
VNPGYACRTYLNEAIEALKNLALSVGCAFEVHQLMHGAVQNFHRCSRIAGGPIKQKLNEFLFQRLVEQQASIQLLKDMLRILWRRPAETIKCPILFR